MNFVNFIIESYGLVKYYKLKFILGLLGIVAAIASISAVELLNYNSERNAAMLKQKYGAYQCVASVIPLSKAAKTKLSHAWLVDKSQNKLANINANISVYPYYVLSAKVTNQKNRIDNLVVGLPPTAVTDLGWKIESGRNMHALDDNKKLCIVGNKVAVQQFDHCRIEGQDFSVIARLKAIDLNPLLDFNPDNSIFIPLSSVKRLLPGAYVDNFIIESRNMHANEVQAIFTNAVKQQFNDVKIYFRDSGIFQQAALQQINSLAQLLKLVAGISSVLGVISILNLLLNLLEDRRNEFGLRLCMGASKAQVIRQVSLELLLICSAGGIIGVVLGQLSAYIIVRNMDFDFYASYLPCLTGLALAAFLGILSGLSSLIFIRDKSPVGLIYK